MGGYKKSTQFRGFAGEMTEKQAVKIAKFSGQKDIESTETIKQTPSKADFILLGAVAAL